MLDKPIFLVGVGRSGSTALLLALSRHPSILGHKAESPFIPFVGGLVGRMNRFERSGYVVRMLRVTEDHLNESLRTICFESTFGPGMGRGFRLKRLLRLDFSGLLASHWIARTWMLEEDLEGLKSLFPSMKVVYLVRNGYRVVASRMKYGTFKKYGFEANCTRWAENADQHAFLESSESAVVIRHEDLIADPVSTLSLVYSHVGLPHSTGPERYLASTLVHPLSDPSSAGVDVASYFKDRRSPESDWTPEEHATFTRICGPAMKRLGYELREADGFSTSLETQTP